MSERTIFNYLQVGWLGLSVAVFIALLFFTAPYGRHTRRGWGLTVDNRLGWVVMEAASPLAFAACFVLGSREITAATLAFLVMWEAHYIHRAFIYPFSLRDNGKVMPLAVACFGLVFNLVNGYLNGRYLFTFSGGYSADWLRDPRFVAGLVLFVVGFVINRSADATLRRLRQPGETAYVIPNGGLYRWVSCPNYLGEIIIWSGWALATWSPPGAVFAVWTAANLVPRARSHHRWYQEQFPDYPPERRALIPRFKF